MDRALKSQVIHKESLTGSDVEDHEEIVVEKRESLLLIVVKLNLMKLSWVFIVL